MSSSRVLRLGETFGDVTNVLYVQGKIVEDCLDWELSASQMRHRYIHLRPWQGPDARWIRAGMFCRCRE